MKLRIALSCFIPLGIQAQHGLRPGTEVFADYVVHDDNVPSSTPEFEWQEERGLRVFEDVCEPIPMNSCPGDDGVDPYDPYTLPSFKGTDFIKPRKNFSPKAGGNTQVWVTDYCRFRLSGNGVSQPIYTCPDPWLYELARLRGASKYEVIEMLPGGDVAPAASSCDPSSEGEECVGVSVGGTLYSTFYFPDLVDATYYMDFINMLFNTYPDIFKTNFKRFCASGPFCKNGFDLPNRKCYIRPKEGECPLWDYVVEDGSGVEVLVTSDVAEWFRECTCTLCMLTSGPAKWTYNNNPFGKIVDKGTHWEFKLSGSGLQGSERYNCQTKAQADAILKFYNSVKADPFQLIQQSPVIPAGEACLTPRKVMGYSRTSSDTPETTGKFFYIDPTGATGPVSFLEFFESNKSNENSPNGLAIRSNTLYFAVTLNKGDTAPSDLYKYEFYHSWKPLATSATKEASFLETIAGATFVGAWYTFFENASANVKQYNVNTGLTRSFCTIPDPPAPRTPRTLRFGDVVYDRVNKRLYGSASDSSNDGEFVWFSFDVAGTSVGSVCNDYMEGSDPYTGGTLQLSLGVSDNILVPAPIYGHATAVGDFFTVDRTSGATTLVSNEPNQQYTDIAGPVPCRCDAIVD